MALYLGRDAKFLNPSWYGEVKNWYITIGEGAFQTDISKILNMATCNMLCKTCTGAASNQCITCYT
jgi:hypothetical protein